MKQVSLPKNVHRVRRRLANGLSRWHFYAWRGGPRFWTDDKKVPEDKAFFHAFSEATARPKSADYMVPQMVDDFLSSSSMPQAKRSREDAKKWAWRFAQHFSTAPAAIFEDRRARGELNKWRAVWKHSPKQHDMAGTHAVRVLNWAVEEGLLSEHHCHKLRRLYEVDRSGVVWTRSDRDAINAIAPEWVQRILCVACETGLRPGDLIKLTRAAVENTPAGRRLRVRTNKRKKLAHIPITPVLAKVIDAIPTGQLLILTNASGAQLTEHRASEGLRQWRDKAGLNRDLRLQDCRGTAATRLLDAGLSLSEIANHMGWSIRNAANVIEHYARVSPDETDAVLVKLARAKGGAQ
ncbi:tyrosine-type recombinase/integrase [Sulfitobacter guttiformis]|uniref:Phage integrase family protein n=1 Tax=Sulfitobacter guttiformis TaxID=74349 RepID=A0A420DNU9_9RHOB|nr:tyrosine-type recombinase/integrase [Sulfitobacter guttiformis]KIN73259.1 putative integrase for prophage [Sulfitobacter guttiformis KCTC 32187]RKE95931.1 phage integrase family protein [Sulfitobacter guttiformis]